MRKGLADRSQVAGIGLLEILVVVGIFAIVGILTTLSLSLSLSGSRKSESTLLVRENVEYALAVTERQLRNASGVDPCPNADKNRLVYQDQLGQTTSFSCENLGDYGYFASGSAELTSNKIAVIACSLDCNPGTAGTPPAVTISLTAKSSQTVLAKEGGQVTVNTKILLRTY